MKKMSTDIVERRVGMTPSAGFVTSPAHNEQRKTIIKAILRLLLERRPYADAAWRERIARMAKKLEARLYFTSNSLEEHLNLETLRPRLQRVANEVLNARRPTVPANSNVTEEDVRETENLLTSFTGNQTAVAAPPVGELGETAATATESLVGAIAPPVNPWQANLTQIHVENPQNRAQVRRPFDPTRTTVRRFVLYRTANAA